MDQPVAEILYDIDDHNGYTLITHRDFNQEAKKIIWLSALPSGSDWNRPVYAGNKIIKTFKVGKQYAVSRIKVTDQADEVGRMGILNAQVFLMDDQQYMEWMRTEREKYNNVRLSVSNHINIIFQRLKFAIQGKFSYNKLIIQRPTRSQQDIDLNLSILLNLSLRDSLPEMLMGFPSNRTFTSITLATNDQAPIMCVPSDIKIKIPPRAIHIQLNK